MFEFTINKKDTRTKARTGEFKTPHGVLQTPSLAIVGTEGQIKSIPPDTAKTLPLNYTIVNTFHIWTKGIIEKITIPVTRNLKPKTLQNNTVRLQATGYRLQTNTVHSYGGLPGVVASDSGGFQVFSLGFGKSHKVGKLFRHSALDAESIQINYDETSSKKIQWIPDQVRDDVDNPLTITEAGVEFEWDSQKKMLTPELSMELQHTIGADIMFAFDECTSPLNSKEYVAKSVELTDRWLERCIKAKNVIARTAATGRSNLITNNPKADRNGIASSDTLLAMTKIDQALFAIVQGGEWQDLRIKSAKLCAKHDVPGFGIGGSFGSSFGDSKKNMHQVLEWIMPHLPDEKPSHLLGIGQVDDLFECVERGVDLFDCVIPTREARHRVLYTKTGKIEVKRIKTSNDPITLYCKCIACTQKITGRQLYELFLQKDPRAYFYATVHNIQFFSDLMGDIRNSIQTNTFQSFKDEMLTHY